MTLEECLRLSGGFPFDVKSILDDRVEVRFIGKTRSGDFVGEAGAGDISDGWRGDGWRLVSNSYVLKHVEGEKLWSFLDFPQEVRGKFYTVEIKEIIK